MFDYFVGFGDDRNGGWVVGPVTVEHVLSRYLILLFALVGGAPFGASVGVITGLILSLANSNAVYQMSLLAFSGMLAGLLKGGESLDGCIRDAARVIDTLFLYGIRVDVINSTWESLAAVALFLLTPRSLILSLLNMCPVHRKI